MSDFGFPKYTPSQRVGRAGEAWFEQFVVSELGWVYRPVHRESDFGIDGYVDIVIDGTVTGRGLAVQIKSGDSYVGKRTTGGIKYEGSNQHLNYYLNQSVPVVLVVLSGDCKEGYWAEFDITRTSRSTSGWWLEIPMTNRLSAAVASVWASIAGPVQNYSDTVQMMWAVDDLIDSTDYRSFAIPYEEVQECSLEFLTALLNRLCKTRDSLLANRGKLEIYFPGYDSDRRELYQIPEIRKWFAATLAHDIPWFYFLDTRGKGNSIKLLLLCTCDVQVGVHNGRKVLYVSGEEQSRWMTSNFHNLNKFTELHDISEATNEELSLAVIECLEKSFAEVEDS